MGRNSSSRQSSLPRGVIALHFLAERSSSSGLVVYLGPLSARASVAVRTLQSEACWWCITPSGTHVCVLHTVAGEQCTPNHSLQLQKNPVQHLPGLSITCEHFMVPAGPLGCTQYSFQMASAIQIKSRSSPCKLRVGIPSFTNSKP